MDPVEIHDATVLATKEKVRNVISILDPELSFHDFRMINGAEKKKLIFDLEIPYSYKKKDCDRVIGQIGALMKEMDEKYECVVNIDKKLRGGRVTTAGLSRQIPSKMFQNVSFHYTPGQAFMQEKRC